MKRSKWPGHRFALIFFLAILLTWLIGSLVLVNASAARPGDSGQMLVVFAPSTVESRIFSTIVAAGARPVRPTWMPGTWVIDAEHPGAPQNLKNSGALGVYRDNFMLPQLAGCFAYADARTVRLFTARP